MKTLGIKNTASVLASQNVEALKLGAGLTVGRIMNQNISKAIKPHLPIFVRGYADEPWFQALVGNLVAGAIINFVPNNEKLVKCSEWAVQAGMIDIIQGFDLEAKAEEFLSGIGSNIPEMPKMFAQTNIDTDVEGE